MTDEIDSGSETEALTSSDDDDAEDLSTRRISSDIAVTPTRGNIGTAGTSSNTIYHALPVPEAASTSVVVPQSDTVDHPSTSRSDTVDHPSTSCTQRGKKRGPEVLEENEPDCCVICFEPYTSAGPHRLVSLACGHVFGDSCVRKCIDGKKRCPQCNCPAKIKDIRNLYVQTIRAVDNTEEDRLRRELEQQKATANKQTIELYNLRTQVASLQDRISELEKEKMRILANRDLASSSQFIRSASSVSFSWQATFEVSKSGSCRVMTYSSVQHIGVASTTAMTGLFNFAKYGFRRFNLEEKHPGDYLGIHAKEIRDMAFNPKSDMLLMTASLDQTVKMTDLRTKRAVSTVTLDKPAWACCWHGVNSDQFYVGLQTGKLKLYDVRTFAEPVEELESSVTTGILGLTYVHPDTRSSAFSSAGVIAGRLKSCEFYASVPGGGHVEHSLKSAGSAAFNSVSFEPVTRHLLLSHRGGEVAGGGGEPAAHAVCQLSSRFEGDTRVFACDEVSVVRGAKDSPRLCRSLLFSNPFDREAALVLADFDGRMAGWWDAGSGRCMERVATGEPMLDACLVQLKDSHLVALLTAHGIRVHKITCKE